MTRIPPIAVLFTALLVPAAGVMAGTCLETDTPADCLDRIVAEGQLPEAQAESPEGDAEIQTESTGLDAAAEGSATTIEDFLSRFRVTATPSLTGPEKGSVVIDVGNFLGIPTDDGYKLELIRHEAKLYEPLKLALPAATRETRSSELAKELGDLSDRSIVFSYSPTGRKMGRRMTGTLDALYSVVLARSGATSGVSAEHLAILSSFKPKVATDPGYVQWYANPANKNTWPPFSRIQDATLRHEFMAAVAAGAKIEADRRVGVRDELTRARFMDLADLAANQPQLFFSASARTRDHLVGPNETGLSISYEMGFTNVNSMRRHCAKSAPDGEPIEDFLARSAGLECYTSYVQEAMTGLKYGDRLKFTLEYSEVESYDEKLPADGVDLHVDGSHKLVAGLSYGRYVGFGDDGEGNARLDIEAAYEDYGGDPNRNDRKVATLMYSRDLGPRLGKRFGIGVGLTYASNPEFRGDVDEEFGTHFGLTYKLLDRKAKKAKNTKDEN